MRALLVVFAFLAVWPVAAQDPAPPVDIPALVKAGADSYLHGDYEAAHQAFLKAWDLAQQTPAENPARYDILKRLVSVRAAVSEFADADNYLELALQWRQVNVGPDDPKIVDDLLISVGLDRGRKNYERAQSTLSRIMRLHQQASGPSSVAVADDFSRMAQISMEQKNVNAAIQSLNAALTIRTKLTGPLDPTLISDLDRLAGAFIASRAYDKAEDAYRHVLVIRETLYGKEDADLIATVDGLAYACFGQQKYDVAEPIYKRLVDLWIKSVGDDHPMVAMVLDKVAVFYFEQKKYDQAKEAEDRANVIRTHGLIEGLSRAGTEQIAQGNSAAAVALYKRVLALMDPEDSTVQEKRDGIEKMLRELEPPAPKPSPKKTISKKK